MAFAWEATLLLAASLTKHYPYFSVFIRLWRILKIWGIFTFVFGFLYSGMAEIFNFTYDYRLLVALIFGVGLLIKEFSLKYYFN